MTLSRCGRQYTFEEALKSAQARGFKSVASPGSIGVVGPALSLEAREHLMEFQHRGGQVLYPTCEGRWTVGN